MKNKWKKYDEPPTKAFDCWAYSPTQGVFLAEYDDATFYSHQNNEEIEDVTHYMKLKPPKPILIT